MRHLLVFLFVGSFVFVNAQVKFDDYFLPKTMRVDYSQSGNAHNALIFFEQIKSEPYWGGSQKNLLDAFDYGDYRYLVYDSTSNELIFSRGYSNLFREWQDTPEAKVMRKSFYESIVFPYPKNTVRLEIQSRSKNQKFNSIFSHYINPDNYFIVEENPLNFKTKKIHDSGNPATNIDVVIIPEGYTKSEMKKFRKDAERFVNFFFTVSPFKENKGRFNYWTVEAISEESGTDIPGKDIWRKTILNTHFYTFNSERYLTTKDIRSVRDIAACVPYDQIYILVNTEKYGGGGIYNYYNLCSSDNEQSEKVFVHEFGHAFAALADEYDYGYDKAENLYDMTVEPYQPNITNLVDFEKKWKNMVDSDTPIPTSTDGKYRNKVGAFEGAGYVKKKIYRPVADCKMRSNNVKEFCPVCKKVLVEMIIYYSE